MKKLSAILAVVVCVALTLTMVVNSEEQNEPSSLRPFANGSIVCIMLASNPTSSMYMEEPEVKKIGEASFLVGKSAELPGFPVPPQSVFSWVPMSSVLHIYEYRDAEDFREGFKLLQKQTPGELANQK